jgi:hypothetical protein
MGRGRGTRAAVNVPIGARARGAQRLTAPHHGSEVLDPELAEQFTALNRLHFDGALPAVPVYKGLPRNAGHTADVNGLCRLSVFGDTDTSPVLVTLYLSNRLFDADMRSVAACSQAIQGDLLHEMVHLAVYLDALGAAHPVEDGHGRPFADECNRIGAASGWAQVSPVGESIHGTAGAADWPRNVWDE